MVYTIKVTTSPRHLEEEGLPLFAEKFNNSQEFEAVLNLCDNKRRIGWLESLIIPIRTDDFNNLCKDFFLPGFFNEALVTKKVALKIFLCIFMPICDIITLPIRLFTVIPRFIYNNASHPKESHPFYQYLIANKVSAKYLSAGHVYLETVRVGESEDQSLLRTQGRTFNFMHLPESASSITRVFQVC